MTRLSLNLMLHQNDATQVVATVGRKTATDVAVIHQTLVPYATAVGEGWAREYLDAMQERVDALVAIQTALEPRVLGVTGNVTPFKVN